ncbi:MAG: type II toxin-antitoxin system RelE/ParE family toxin [Pirellulales bacterium]
MPQVLLTRAAEEARIEIWLHIARDNSTAADNVVEEIDRRCRLCASQPLLGEGRPDLGSELRCFPVGSYVVIYRPLVDGIEVLLVIHGARDIPSHLRKLFRPIDR